MKKVFALFILGLAIAQVLAKKSAGAATKTSERSKDVETHSESQASVKVNKTTYVKVHDAKDGKKEDCKKFCLKDKKFVCCPQGDEGRKDRKKDN